MGALALISRIPLSFWRFGLVGVGGLFVDMAVLYAVMWSLCLSAMSGKVFSFLAAATFTWWMNRRYTFGRSGKSLIHEWASFLATNAFGGAVNFAVYTAMVTQAFPYVWMPALATAAGSLGGLLFNYTASRHIVFKTRQRKATQAGCIDLPAPNLPKSNFLCANMKFNPLPWLLILATLGLSGWLRSQLIEQNELAFFCADGGQTLECKVRWLVEKSFNHLGLGYFALFLGLLSAITRSGLIGLLAGIVGMAGLMLYCWDYAAVGFLLGVLTLARAQFDDYRAQHRAGQQQA